MDSVRGLGPEDYTDEELRAIIARGESERAGDEQAANIDLNLDG